MTGTFATCESRLSTAVPCRRCAVVTRRAAALGMPRIPGVAHRNVAIFVEPSPFSHVSGMKNRFECLIRNLRDQGDDVIVFTPDKSPPKDYYGAKVRSASATPSWLLAWLCSRLKHEVMLQIVKVLGFKLPFYQAPTLLLSLGLSVRVLWYLMTKRPDIIHVSSPGLLVFSAVLYAKLLSIPLVVSYHTHIPEYIPRYTWKGLVGPMWSIIRWCTRMSDLTLVTSKAMMVRTCVRMLTSVQLAHFFGTQLVLACNLSFRRAGLLFTLVRRAHVQPCQQRHTGRARAARARQAQVQ
jgi:sulfoquinovosyltransferase